MNYYTVKGCNANKFFKLDLHPDLYYDWDDVKKRADGRMKDEYDDKERDEIEGNVSNFQEVIDGRRRRENVLKEELKKKNIKFIPHSYVIRNYIMYNRRKFKEVVDIMKQMNILFEKCDIVNKWEKHKVSEGKQIYSFDEKDEYYKKTYLEYLKNKFTR